MLDKKQSVPYQLFTDTLKGNKLAKTPVWFMRQAGRYLPEYKEVRATTNNFLEFCYSPKKASEVTLQPIDRFDFDAAVIFSDILVIPDALGQKVEFVKNEGPKLEALEDKESIKNLSFNEEKLAPVYEALQVTRGKLAKEKSLIGFAGSPWTLATYMIEGKGSKDYLKTKSWSYSQSENMEQLFEKLVDSISNHLINQVKAGADALQLFDSWAGVLNEEQFDKFCIKPTAEIVSKVKAVCPDVPIIGFPKGSGVFYKDYATKTGVDAISFDHNMPCKWIYDNIKTPVQGNLDPVLLMNDKEKAVENTLRILDVFKDKPHVFNLGHGILQYTPIENVAAVVEAVKNHG